MCQNGGYIEPRAKLIARDLISSYGCIDSYTDTYALAVTYGDPRSIVCWGFLILV